jgi:hypothetical protein
MEKVKKQDRAPIFGDWKQLKPDVRFQRLQWEGEGGQVGS